MSIFELNPSCLVLSSGGDNTKTTTMANQNEYYQLLFPVMDVNSQEFGNGISYDSTNNAFKFTQTGVFLMQCLFTLQGGSNDVYEMRMYNDDTSERISYTFMEFSTKGTNYWEVQNMFLLKNEGRSVTGNNSGILTYNNTYKFEIQRTENASGNITIYNMNVIIYKIA
jgi:hypothetical protein